MNSQAVSKLSATLPYVAPFVLFALITYCGPLLSLPVSIVYSIKTVAVGALIVWYWRSYADEIRLRMDLPAVVAGVLVFVLWVGLEGYYPQLGSTSAAAAGSASAYSSVGFLVVRMIGAVLVVPVMEELFWRSFALRFLIDSNFKKVPLGQFAWFSFVAVSVAFGLEHHRWLPGIVAGAIYAAVLYRTKNLFSPVLAHAVTNLLLGIYVIEGGHWAYW
jgi:CAAX prenyl protease-like protein